MRIALLYLFLFGMAIISCQRPSPRIFWVDSTYNHLVQFDIDNGKAEVLVEEGLGFPWRVAADAENGYLYWSNVNANLIQRSKLDGSEVEIIGEVSYPQGVALDVSSNTLYIAESGTPMIFKIDLATHAWDTLITEEIIDPDDIHVDSDAGKMFWIDTALNGLFQANLDGSELQEIRLRSVISIAGIAIDRGRKCIFIGDAEGNSIHAIGYDGSEQQVIVADAGIPKAIGCIGDCQTLYWIDAGSMKLRKSVVGSNQIDNIHDNEVGNFQSGMTLIDHVKN